MWARNLAEEAKVNCRVRKSFWRSQDSIEVGRGRCGGNVGGMVCIFGLGRRYARWKRQPTIVIWEVKVLGLVLGGMIVTEAREQKKRSLLWDE